MIAQLHSRNDITTTVIDEYREARRRMQMSRESAISRHRKSYLRKSNEYKDEEQETKVQ